MRQRETLRYDQTVFRDRKVFEFTYMPDELHHRDAQIRELALLARLAIRDGSPKSAILRGPPRHPCESSTDKQLSIEKSQSTNPLR